MFIKSVKISNFKSYKNACVLNDLSLGLNTFVGQNGVGKSNLIEAIHFLLRGNRDCKRNSKEGKNLHLMRYDGHEAISVEIVLRDDEGVEVKVKKTWSSRGFRYFVDDVCVSAKLFGQLFRHLRFPGSPEFFVVNSNLRKSLTQMSNQKMLNFIISSLGQSVSKGLNTLINVISSTEKSFNKINQLYEGLQMAKAFLNDFDDLPKWKKYQKLSKKKDFLDTLIRLHTLNNTRNKKISKFGPILTPKETESCYAQIHELENNQKCAEDNIIIAEMFIERYEEERLDIVSELEKVKFQLDESTANYKNISHTEQTFDDDLSIALAQLSSIACSLDQENKKMNTLQTDLKRQESERQLIIEKFTLDDNPELIADWYSEKIKMTVKNLFCEEQKGVHLQKMIDEEKEVLKKHQDDFSQLKADHEVEQSMMTSIRTLQTNSINLQIQLDQLRKEENILEFKIRKSEGKLNDAKIHLVKTIGPSVFEGMLSVQKVISYLKEKNEDISGYYGLIIDNFDCNPGLYNAIDASAGKKLFYHLISKTEVGNLILNNMKLLNLSGEVTFIPLDKIKPHDKINVVNNNVVPLLMQMEYEKQFEKAMVYCFGRTLICRNLEVAVTTAKDHRCLAVTVEGDLVRSGTLSGGYIGQNRSVKFNFGTYTEIAEIKNHQISDLSHCKEKISKISDDINKIVSEIEKVDLVKRVCVLETKASEIKINFCEEKLNKLSAEKEILDNDIAILSNNLNILRSQGSILDTDIESERLHVVNRTIFDLKEQFHQQSLIILSYERKMDDIQTKIKRIKEAQKESLIDNNKKQCLELNISNFKEQENLILERLNQCLDFIQESQENLRNYHHQVRACKENISKIKQKIEKSNQNFNLIEASISSLNIEIKKITDSLTKDGNWNKYKDLPLIELNGELERTIREIKEMGKVIYSSKIEQKTKMLNKFRIEHDEVFKLACMASIKLMEINGWYQSHIEGLIEEISILMNFYFKMFNPNMEVKLRLESDEDEINSLVGISVEVSSEGMTLERRSLSGSHQTALVISLIFSIAQIVNFKFIMMDEVDSYLDEECTARFTQMISEMSDVQILATSHKKDIILESKNIFLIQNRNGRSYVESIDIASETVNETIDLLPKETVDSSDSDDPKSDSSYYSPPSSPPF